METYTIGFASNNSTQMSSNNNNHNNYYELDQTNKINNDLLLIWSSWKAYTNFFVQVPTEKGNSSGRSVTSKYTACSKLKGNIQAKLTGHPWWSQLKYVLNSNIFVTHGPTLSGVSKNDLSLKIKWKL